MLLRFSDVCSITSLSKSTIYRYMGRGEFPKAISFNYYNKRWSKNEIQEWIDKWKKKRIQSL
ncbi:MAG: AlpA family phage regulatory protein [Deltaproteobacteria bacterium]|nr:AlpA family phage regulatory protein [Deltaproteobacteria bacterium]